MMVGCGGHLLPTRRYGATQPGKPGGSWDVECAVPLVPWTGVNAQLIASARGSGAMLSYYFTSLVDSCHHLGSSGGPEDSWQGIADFQAPMAMGPMMSGRDAGAVPLAGFGAGCLSVNS